MLEKRVSSLIVTYLRNWDLRFEIDSYLAFLYKAIERLAQLVAHSDGIAVDREVLVDPQRLEVGAKADLKELPVVQL